MWLKVNVQQKYHIVLSFIRLSFGFFMSLLPSISVEDKELT